MQTSHITRRAGLAFFAFTLGLAGQVAVAQTYPSKAVTIVVPFPAGGPNDILARTLGERLAAQMKQPFIVENKAGATGNIGALAVTKASAPETRVRSNPAMASMMPPF